MNIIIHPVTKKKLHIHSIEGKQLLKQYIKYYQTGGRRGVVRSETRKASRKNEKKTLGKGIFKKRLSKFTTRPCKVNTNYKGFFRPTEWECNQKTKTPCHGENNDNPRCIRRGQEAKQQRKNETEFRIAAATDMDFQFNNINSAIESVMDPETQERYRQQEFNKAKSSINALDNVYQNIEEDEEELEKFKQNLETLYVSLCSQTDTEQDEDIKKIKNLLTYDEQLYKEEQTSGYNYSYSQTLGEIKKKIITKLTDIYDKVVEKVKKEADTLAKAEAAVVEKEKKEFQQKKGKDLLKLINEHKVKIIEEDEELDEKEKTALENLSSHYFNEEFFEKDIEFENDDIDNIEKIANKLWDKIDDDLTVLDENLKDLSKFPNLSIYKNPDNVLHVYLLFDILLSILDQFLNKEKDDLKKVPIIVDIIMNVLKIPDEVYKKSKEIYERYTENNDSLQPQGQKKREIPRKLPPLVNNILNKQDPFNKFQILGNDMRNKAIVDKFANNEGKLAA